LSISLSSAKPYISRSVKKSARKPVKKIGQKLLKLDSKTNMPNFQLPDMDQITMVVAPNMSRRRKDFTLYAFPNFNKCDALLYFPSTMARHLNSGDNSSLSELFAAHFHKNCVAELYCGSEMRLGVGKLLDLFELANDLHPDSMMCMHSTKVVDNEIQATLYFKSTECYVIYESMKRMVVDPAFAGMFTGSRVDRLKESINFSNKSEEDVLAIYSLAESDADYIVYGQLDMRLRFDDTKRVVNVKFTPTLTSVIQVQI